LLKLAENDDIFNQTAQSSSITDIVSVIVIQKTYMVYLIYLKSDNHIIKHSYIKHSIRIPFNIKLIYCKLGYYVINCKWHKIKIFVELFTEFLTYFTELKNL